MNYVNRVRAFVIGVGNYEADDLTNLAGPQEDVAQIRHLLTRDPTGLYNDDQVTVLEDPSLDDVRKEFVDYVRQRSAKGDICLVFFSGHGCVLRGNEFAFCFRDARLRSDSGDMLPLSVMRFSDLLGTLATADITPVVIVDACNSGVTGWATSTGVSATLESMHDQMHRSAGTTYAMLCACSERHVASDDINGGAFTSAMIEVLEGGLVEKHKRKETVTLSDVFPQLQRACEQVPDIALPRLYLSPDLPPFELCRNVAYQRLSYRFTPYMKELVEELWNNGKPREMTLAQIRSFRAGSYGNHNKLSYAPWDLIEDVPGAKPRTRRLTERGRKFAQGKLEIVREIEADDATPTGFRAADGSLKLKIDDI